MWHFFVNSLVRVLSALLCHTCHRLDRKISRVSISPHRVLGGHLTYPKNCPCPKRVFLGSEQLGEQRLLKSFCSEWRKRYSIFGKKISFTIIDFPNIFSLVNFFDRLTLLQFYLVTKKFFFKNRVPLPPFGAK